MQSAVSARKEAPAPSFSSPISNPAAAALETLAKESHQIALTLSFLKLTCLQCSLLFATKPELLFYKVRSWPERDVCKPSSKHFWFCQFASSSVCVDLKICLFCVYLCIHTYEHSMVCLWDTVSKSWLSPSITWVLGWNLGCQAWHKCLDLMSHLTGLGKDLLKRNLLFR